MLATNLPMMKESIKRMITDVAGAEDNGALYKAAKDAHYAASVKTYNLQMESYNNSNTNPNTVMGPPDSDVKQQWEDMAKEFAKVFVDTLIKEGFHNTLADIIDKHVKSIEPIITMTVPAHGALSGAMGPVAGTLVGTVSNGAIQIT